MAIYNKMAEFYDALTGDVEYEKWADFYEKLFSRYFVKPETLLDLACGTGSMAKLMSLRGYDVIGVDASSEMLSAAFEKMSGFSKPPLLICQKMEELDLYGTVDSVLCCLDSINYLNGVAALNKAFKRVGLFLRPGGLFIFDVNTRQKFKNMHMQCYMQEKKDLFCVWQAEYNEDAKKADFYINFFERTNADKYVRHTEHHTEHAFSLVELENALKIGGMEILDVFGEYELRKANATDERIVIAARKK